MNLLATIISVVIVIVVLGLIVYWAIIRYSRTKEEVEQGPVIINYSQKYSNGYGMGIETKCEVGKGGRMLCEFIPVDESLRDIEDIKPQKIIIGKGKRRILPQGSFSQRRNSVIYLPPSAGDIPNDLKETPEGQFLMKLTEKINIQNTEAEIYLKRIGVTDDIAMKEIGGELMKNFLSSNMELTKDFKNFLEVIKEDRKKSSFDVGTKST